MLPAHPESFGGNVTSGIATWPCRLLASPVDALALDVYLPSHDLKVIRPNAVAAKAQVVSLETSGRLADEEVVSKHALKVAVASLANVSGPQPTSVSLFDLKPKALLLRGVCLAVAGALRTLAPALVMHVAKAMTPRRTGAAFNRTSDNLGLHRKLLTFGVMRQAVRAVLPPFVGVAATECLETSIQIPPRSRGADRAPSLPLRAGA